MTLQSGVKSASRPAAPDGLRATLDTSSPLYDLGTYRVRAANGGARMVAEELVMAGLSHRGWTAGERLAACVICGKPAILRSSKGRPCHWSCAVT
jgi:hypothetical protein